MIVAAWIRFTQGGGVKWLLLAGGIVVADVLVGARLVAWEIELIRGVWNQ